MQVLQRYFLVTFRDYQGLQEILNCQGRRKRGGGLRGGGGGGLFFICILKHTKELEKCECNSDLFRFILEPPNIDLIPTALTVYKERLSRADSREIYLQSTPTYKKAFWKLVPHELLSDEIRRIMMTWQNYGHYEWVTFQCRLASRVRFPVKYVESETRK